MVRKAPRIIMKALVSLWENILVLVAANAIWAFSLVPGIFIFSIGGGIWTLLGAIFFLIFLSGPTTVGLFYLTSNISRLERVELRDFFTGIKLYYGRGWLLSGLNVLFFLLAYFNLTFYTSPDLAGNPVSYLFLLWIYLIMVWFIFQIYVWPLALRMEKFKIILLLRNAAIASFKYPFYSLAIGLVLFLTLLGSIISALVITVIFGAAFHTLLSNKALMGILELEEEKNAGLAEKNQVALDLPLAPVKKEPEKELRAPGPTRNIPPGVIKRSPGLPRNLPQRGKREKDG